MRAYIPLVTGDSLCGQPVLALDSPCWDMLVLERGWTLPAHNSAPVSWLSCLCPGRPQGWRLDQGPMGSSPSGPPGTGSSWTSRPRGGLGVPVPFLIGQGHSAGTRGAQAYVFSVKEKQTRGTQRGCPALPTPLLWELPCPGPRSSLWRGGRPLAGSRAHGAARRWAEGASPAGRPRGTAARPT